MPLDINLLRTNAKLVEESQIRRFKEPKLVQEILDLDNQWKTAISQLDQIRKESRSVSKQIGEIMKKAVRIINYYTKKNSPEFSIEN